ncbi:hypothetical protein EQO05_02640 [Methanosarcina sp. MSH10X1]|uniref:hypothetical protein n=1 Tax=Methanosarcina sp. MSH10X1 TaxID=2507075 RepID=UPI000FFC77EB|nr:hypothetical protein [Methanosarcina sp. MSH10X1]RXA21338.1 hypothetical protein EQO05_02640 [Methanosarcina sp. MSH10X1]
MIPDASIKRNETRKTNQGLFSHFSKSESAAATIILAILLLALVFAMVSIVRLEYVPEWKNEAEQDHMYEIWDDLLELKLRIDMLSGLMESGSYPANDFSATVPFSMGGGDIPVFEPSRSDGKLEVNKERCVMIITLYNSTNEAINFYKFDCGGITCNLRNRQYPDQFFRYENGALILSDGTNSVLRQSPVFTIEENKTIKGSYTVNIRAVQLSGKADSFYSNTITPLELTGLSSKREYNNSEDKNTSVKAFNMTIATKYPDAWTFYLKETAESAGLDYGTDYEIERQDPNCVYFKFMPKDSKKLDRLNIDRSIIQVDLEAGSSPILAEPSIDESIPVDVNESVMKLNQWYHFDTFTGTSDGNSISGSTDPNVFNDYDEASSLPTGNFENQQLSSYSAVNDFSHNMEKNHKTLDLNFGFDSFSSFNSASAPTKADVCMIYRFDNKDKSNGKNKDENKNNGENSNKKPDIKMSFEDATDSTFEPGDGWCLYNRTLSMSPGNPEDITLNLTVTTGNGNYAEGTFHIDYLAVRPE